MPYRNLLVLGGTGFIGQALVGQLVRRGCNVRVPTRRRVRGRDLLVLPTVEVIECDIADPATLRSLLADCDAAVNLVGVLNDVDGGVGGRARPAAGAERASYGPGFAAAHVELPRRLVAACKAQGVHRLLHVSALGADAAAPSQYLRSKAEGERIVRDAVSLATTVLRPSVVFGMGDHFLNQFATLAAFLPVLPVGGAGARMQPVWVEDLASALCHALDQAVSVGRCYEICGPQIYTLAQLVGFAAHASGHPRPVIGLPAWLARVLALGFECLPGPTLLSRDNLRSLLVDSVAASQPYRPAPELGFEPTPLEPQAALYLAGAHPRTRYGDWRARTGR
jgi:NADH dehydrogenase